MDPRKTTEDAMDLTGLFFLVCLCVALAPLLILIFIAEAIKAIIATLRERARRDRTSPYGPGEEL